MDIQASHCFVSNNSILQRKPPPENPGGFNEVDETRLELFLAGVAENGDALAALLQVI